MADRDLLEDEDLSVLLQLASHSNTPRSKDGRYVDMMACEFIAILGFVSYFAIVVAAMSFDRHELEKEVTIGTAPIQRCNYRLLVEVMGLAAPRNFRRKRHEKVLVLRILPHHLFLSDQVRQARQGMFSHGTM